MFLRPPETTNNNANNIEINHSNKTKQNSGNGLCDNLINIHYTLCIYFHRLLFLIALVTITIIIIINMVGKATYEIRTFVLAHPSPTTHFLHLIRQLIILLCIRWLVG